MLALRKSGSEVWTTDVAVPLSRVDELIGKSRYQETQGLPSCN